jgi:hypothetical protein
MPMPKTTQDEAQDQNELVATDMSVVALFNGETNCIVQNGSITKYCVLLNISNSNSKGAPGSILAYQDSNFTFSQKKTIPAHARKQDVYNLCCLQPALGSTHHTTFFFTIYICISRYTIVYRDIQ